MSRNKINLSAAHSLLLHFFPCVTANFTRCTKGTLIKAKEPGLTVLFGCAKHRKDQYLTLTLMVGDDSLKL